MSQSQARGGKPQLVGDVLEEIGFPKTGDPLLDAVPPEMAQGVVPVALDWSGRDREVTDLYWDCFDQILDGVSKRKLGEFIKAGEMAAMTATLYIQRCKARGLS